MHEEHQMSIELQSKRTVRIRNECEIEIRTKKKSVIVRTVEDSYQCYIKYWRDYSNSAMIERVKDSKRG